LNNSLDGVNLIIPFVGFYLTKFTKVKIRDFSEFLGTVKLKNFDGKNGNR
jgi:hypothetical protein